MIVASDRGRKLMATTTSKSTETVDLPTKYGDWSDWKTTAVGGGLLKDCRSRQVTYEWMDRTVTTTRRDGTDCPYGYYRSGNRCKLIPGVRDGYAPEYVTPMSSTDTTYGEWHVHHRTVTVTECYAWAPSHKAGYRGLADLSDKLDARQRRRYGLTDLSETLDPRERRTGELADLTKRIDARTRRRFKLESMDLLQGERLKFRREEGTSVLLDGDAIDPQRTIDTSKLQPGAHTIDMCGRSDGPSIDFQFTLNVVPALAFVHEDTPAQNPASVRVQNQSDNPKLVGVDVITSPSGWSGHVKGDAVKLIAPGRTATFRVAALAIDADPDSPKEPVVLDIRAHELGEKSGGTYASLSIRP
jgi:hypothetical protein